MPAWFYILECSDGSYYSGSTIEIGRRLMQHQEGKAANHTARYGPVILVYYEVYFFAHDAFRREQQVKKWSRKKKESLISSNRSELKRLALAKWKVESQKKSR